MSQLTRGSVQDWFEGELRSLPNPARKAVQVVIQSVKDTFIDSGPQWAAALAYYALLSAFPLMIVAMSVASLFTDAESILVDRLTSSLGSWVPQEDRIREVVQQAVDSRGQIGVLAFAGLIWTGTRVFGTLTRAMNIAFDAEESYGVVKRFLIEFVMLLTIGVVFIIAMASGYVTSLLWDAVQFLPSNQGFVHNILTELMQLGMLLLAFFLIYLFVPRSRQDWRSAVAGAGVATLLFTIASPIFQHYISQYAAGRYNAIYGSMWVVIVVLIWVWIVSLIAIFGGEIASHTQKIVIEGESPENVQRQHEARSVEKRVKE